jgi:hypothetical protein
MLGSLVPLERDVGLDAHGCAELAGRRLAAASILEDLCSLLRSASAVAHGTRDPVVCDALHLAAEHVDEALRNLTARRSLRRRWMAWRRPRPAPLNEVAPGLRAKRGRGSVQRLFNPRERPIL